MGTLQAQTHTHRRCTQMQKHIRRSASYSQMETQTRAVGALQKRTHAQLAPTDTQMHTRAVRTHRHAPKRDRRTRKHSHSFVQETVVAPLLCARSLLVSGRQAVCKTQNPPGQERRRASCVNCALRLWVVTALKEHGGQGGALGDVWVEVAT